MTGFAAGSGSAVPGERLPTVQIGVSHPKPRGILHSDSIDTPQAHKHPRSTGFPLGTEHFSLDPNTDSPGAASGPTTRRRFHTQRYL